jgi:hypothetical protein
MLVVQVLLLLDQQKVVVAVEVLMPLVEMAQVALVVLVVMVQQTQ